MSRWLDNQSPMSPAELARNAGFPFVEIGEWPYRWLVTERWDRLHRVISGIKCDDVPLVGVLEGETACGLRGDLEMPGLLSRMGLPRCRRCCRIVGVEPGDGAPYNGGVDG